MTTIKFQNGNIVGPTCQVCGKIADLTTAAILEFDVICNRCQVDIVKAIKENPSNANLNSLILYSGKLSDFRGCLCCGKYSPCKFCNECIRKIFIPHIDYFKKLHKLRSL